MGKVVGSNGHIGSLLLSKGAGTLAAVPCGVYLGCFSPPGTPIYVDVPSTALAQIVLQASAMNCVNDLVLV
eukprot:13646651-Ditylum_brightwellii.AAC.1